MGRRIFKAAVLAATTGIGATFLAPMAAHAAVVCGQTITTSMTLDTDLNCPASNGILINASNVVLDLGGHTITGPAPTGTTTGPGLRGVIVNQNRTGGTVRNGIVRGFDAGVDVAPGANSTTLTGLILDANGTGIRISGGASSSWVTANTVVNTTHFSGMQIGGNGHVVENNSLNNTNGAGVAIAGNNNVVRANRINDAGASAISVSPFPSTPLPLVNNQVTGNQVSGSSRVFNSVSININRGSGTLVDGNMVNGRRTTPGVFVLDSANTVVSGNTLVNNASTGVLVRGASSGTQVLRNTSAQNSFSGITIENGPTSTLVADNIVYSNGGNGIHVASASTTVARNMAVANANWGIFAVAGVTDGGGNTAFSNGNSAQCTANIVCT